MDSGSNPAGLKNNPNEGINLQHEEYANALAALVDMSTRAPYGDQPQPTCPAHHALKHPWLQKFVPGLEKLAVSHHTGNFVAVTRGANPQKEFESMPIYVRLGMHLLYCGKEQEKLLGSSRVDKLLEEQTLKQGEAYDSTENVIPHIENFIKTYSLNTSDLLLQDLAAYKTFNAFFYRKLKPGARPIDPAPNAVVSAADCRLTVWETVDKAREFWIKGEHFSIANMVEDASVAGALENGEVAIFRLAPADYHRFHTPVDATVGPVKKIAGTYFTVNPSAINEDLDVFTRNRRDIMLLSVPRAASGEPMTVAFCCIGAMLVGSIAETVKQGQEVKKGDELGYFAYGGSTVVVVFPPGCVKWDSDLVENSKSMLETAVRVGEHIGTFV